MRENLIREAHNKCIETLNESDLSKYELVATLGQLLIYTGQAISKREIDFDEIDLDYLNKEYYGNNKENDIGLGLILNGASIMGALPNNIKRDETANQENDDDNSLPTTTQVPQKKIPTTS